MSILSRFSNDLAIDLGTANTLVFAKNHGVVLDEPSIVAIEKTRGTVLAVGQEAKNMVGKTPENIVAIKPMKDGVIADFEMTEKMLRYFIRKAHNRRLFLRPRIIICVPSSITPVEKKLFEIQLYKQEPVKFFLLKNRWLRQSAPDCRLPNHPGI